VQVWRPEWSGPHWPCLVLQDRRDSLLQGKSFRSLKGAGFKSNYFDVETGEHYWISGPKRNGEDRLYVSNVPVEVDEDIQEEYWSSIRGLPTPKRT
jgi:hypothetical protein